MGNILILFYSRSGNTKKMAELVKEGCELIPGNTIRLKSITDASADDVFWCDCMALGAPTHLGVVPWKMVQWWDKNTSMFWQKIDGKFACVFSSSGGWGGGNELTCQGFYQIACSFSIHAAEREKYKELYNKKTRRYYNNSIKINDLTPEIIDFGKNEIYKISRG